MAAAARKPEAVRGFLLAVGPHVVRVVRGVLGPRDPDVEDVAQECSFALIDALATFRGECAVVHFVRRITLLTALNARRRERAQKRARERDLGAEVDSFAASDPGPERQVAARASLGVIRELLATLPAGQAEALALHVVLGYTLAEMQDASGIPLETWKSRLRLAKGALRTRMLADPRGSELWLERGEESP
ncbi:MAG TPA: sigma-70 family RNA polymerase sigma factor [Polyangiaceae bacterium]|nr:sigma-70 family RNA polymerase sigma factor [Polyangiaceae bacterium]